MPVSSYIRIPNLYTPSPLHAALSGLMGGMEQSRAAQQQQEQMDLQRQLQEMQMKKQQQQMEMMKKQGALSQQAEQLFGTLPTPGQPATQIPFRDQPGQPGTGFLGGQISQDDLKQGLAKILAAGGDPGKAAAVMFPREQELTAMERNLDARNLKRGTPEYARAATEYMTRTMVPAGIKAGRYGTVEAQSIIDQVESEGVIDSLAKYSGPGGEARKLGAYIGGVLGRPDQDYLKYQSFVNTTVPALGSSIRKMLGDNPSVEQNKMIEKLVNPASYTGSAEETRKNWQQLKDLHKIAAQANVLNPDEITKELNKILTSPRSGDKNVPRGATEEVKETITETPQYSTEYIELLRAEKQRRESSKKNRGM
jgi:hypothetical protein